MSLCSVPTPRAFFAVVGAAGGHVAMARVTVGLGQGDRSCAICRLRVRVCVRVRVRVRVRGPRLTEI